MEGWDLNQHPSSPLPSASASASVHCQCQVEGCPAASADSDWKDYHRRHRVCPAHTKAPHATIRGALCRFCQQCSKFHPLPDFDGSKRSCRTRLRRHNGLRRRLNRPYSLHLHSPSSLSHQPTQARPIILTLLRLISNIQCNSSSLPSTFFSIIHPSYSILISFLFLIY